MYLLCEPDASGLLADLYDCREGIGRCSNIGTLSVPGLNLDFQVIWPTDYKLISLECQHYCQVQRLFLTLARHLCSCHEKTETNLKTDNMTGGRLFLSYSENHLSVACNLNSSLLLALSSKPLLCAMCYKRDMTI